MIDLYLDLGKPCPAAFLELIKVYTLEKKRPFRFLLKKADGKPSNLQEGERLSFVKECPDGALEVRFVEDPISPSSALLALRMGEKIFFSAKALQGIAPSLLPKAYGKSATLAEAFISEEKAIDLGEGLAPQAKGFFDSLCFLSSIEKEKAERNALANYFARMFSYGARSQKTYRKEDYFEPFAILQDEKEKALLLLPKEGSYKVYDRALLLLGEGHDLEDD